MSKVTLTKVAITTTAVAAVVAVGTLAYYGIRALGGDSLAEQVKDVVAEAADSVKEATE